MVGVKARVKKEEQQTATNIMVENIWDYLNDFLTLLWIALHLRLEFVVLGWCLAPPSASSWSNSSEWTLRVNVVEIAQRIFSSRKARNSGEFVSASNRPQRISFIVYICKFNNCWKFLLSRGRLPEVPMTWNWHKTEILYCFWDLYSFKWYDKSTKDFMYLVLFLRRWLSAASTIFPDK